MRIPANPGRLIRLLAKPCQQGRPRFLRCCDAIQAPGKALKTSCPQQICALNNDQEYFAEASEAFFGTNDFHPFVRAELKEHDPALFELLGKLWGVK